MWISVLCVVAGFSHYIICHGIPPQFLLNGVWTICKSIKWWLRSPHIAFPQFVHVTHCKTIHHGYCFSTHPKVMFAFQGSIKSAAGVIEYHYLLMCSLDRKWHSLGQEKGKWYDWLWVLNGCSSLQASEGNAALFLSWGSEITPWTAPLYLLLSVSLSCALSVLALSIPVKLDTWPVFAAVVLLQLCLQFSKCSCT